MGGDPLGPGPYSLGSPTADGLAVLSGQSVERSRSTTPTVMAASAALKMYQKEKWT
jgi:hypothetical protein